MITTIQERRINAISGTKVGGEKAREANYKRYGKDFYRNIGRIGGSNGSSGGFAANPELARKAGALGGRKSKRGAGSITKKKIEPNAEKIEKLYYNGRTLPQIAKELDIPYSSLLKWAHRELVGYGAKDDIERYEMILEHERGRNKQPTQP